MQIPLIQSLVDQTYRANKVEFTWRLPHPNTPKLQVVLEVNNRGAVQVHQNKMVKDGTDFVPDEDDIVHKFPTVEVFEKKMFWLNEPEYQKLTNGQALVHLAKEVVEYLK